MKVVNKAPVGQGQKANAGDAPAEDFDQFGANSEKGKQGEKGIDELDAAPRKRKVKTAPADDKFKSPGWKGVLVQTKDFEGDTHWEDAGELGLANNIPLKFLN